jgi:phage terminase small subunit
MFEKTSNLTPKEQVFVREFLAHGNATRAAETAGYSKATASASGSRLLRNVKVSAELAKLREKLLSKLEISAEKVLQGIAELAFFDPRKMFNPDGSMKKLTDMDEATVHALAGMDVEKLFKHFGKGQAEEVGTITKVRLTDRGLNLERLGRHLKLFTDKLEVHGADGVIERLRAGRARVAAMKKK